MRCHKKGKKDWGYLLGRVLSAAFVLIAVSGLSVLLSACSDKGNVPRELVGRWDHGGSIYSVSRDGKISVWGGSSPIREAGEGRLAIDVNGIEKIYEYHIDRDGVLHLGGTAYYPVP